MSPGPCHVWATVQSENQFRCARQYVYLLLVCAVAVSAFTTTHLFTKLQATPPQWSTLQLMSLFSATNHHLDIIINYSYSYSYSYSSTNHRLSQPSTQPTIRLTNHQPSQPPAQPTTTREDFGGYTLPGPCPKVVCIRVCQ